MSRRQQRRRTARRRGHMAVASGGFAAVASLGVTGVANAAQTFTVTNLSDTGTGSLRDAIASVNADATDTAPGDSIVFASGLTGNLNLTSGELDLSRPAQITGPGANLLTIHAAPNARILYAHADLTLTGLSLTGGAPPSSDNDGNGGAIQTKYALTLNSDVISGNTATGRGGGVDGGLGPPITINASTISGNTAGGPGGGVYAFDGLTVNDSTVTGNAAPSGAGVAVDDPTYLTDSTLTGNTTTGSGGQVAIENHYQLTLDNTIVAGNGSAPDIVLPTGSTETIQFSLIRNPSSAGAGDVGITTDGTDITGLDPQLAPLAANGGPTPTMAPLPTSPVLDRGKAFGITADQRGFPRPFVLPTISFVPPGGDHSDIGAFEAETPAVAAISPSSGGVGTNVAIAGHGFTGATQVLFGSAPASSFTVLNDGAIVATAPAQNGGSLDVHVVTPLGESLAVGTDLFTFPIFTPTVTKPHAKLSGSKVSTGITVSCPSGGFSCAGSFKATAFVKHHKTKIASGSISLSAGQSKTITFKLGSKAMNQLKSTGHMKVTLQIVIADGNGAPITVNRSITLKVKVKHKKH